MVQRACLAMAAIAARGGPDAINSFTTQAVQLARNACSSGDQVWGPTRSLQLLCRLPNPCRATLRMQERLMTVYSSTVTLALPAGDAPMWPRSADSGSRGSRNPTGWQATAGCMRRPDGPGRRRADNTWRRAVKGAVRSRCGHVGGRELLLHSIANVQCSPRIDRQSRYQAKWTSQVHVEHVGLQVARRQPCQQ